MRPKDSLRGQLLASFGLVALLGSAAGSLAVFALGGAGLLLLVLASGAAARRLARLDLQRRAPDNAFEGDTVHVELHLDNHGHAAAHLVEATDSFGAALAETQSLLEPGPLRGGRRRRLGYRVLVTRHWGVHTVGPLTLGAWDPLGLVRASRTLLRMAPLEVFPRVVPMPALARLGARTSLAPEEVQAARAGQASLVLGVRDWRPGDDVRRVHWPATARRGFPVVKEQEAELVPYFTLLLDLDRAHRAGTGSKSTLEYVVRGAASLLWSAAQAGHLVQVVGEGSRSLFVPPGRGPQHAAHALAELIRCRQDGELALDEVVDRHRGAVPAGSTAALLWGSLAVPRERLESALGAIRGRGALPIVLVVNSDSFVQIERRALPDHEVLARRRELAALCRGYGAACAVLSAEDDLAEALARADLFEDGP